MLTATGPLAQTDYNTLLESLPAGLVWLDRELTLVGVNRNFARLVGASRETLLGRSLSDLSADPVRAKLNWQGLLVAPASFCWTLHGEHGTTTALQICGAPFRAATPSGLVALVTELADESEHLAALHDVQSQQRALLDSLPFSAWLKDAEGRFLAVNAPFAQMAGRTVGELVGHTDAEYWPPELANKYREDDLRVMRLGIPLAVEEVIVGPAGETWHETHKNPIFDALGRVCGTAGTARDVTERRHAEQERLALLDQLQKLERLESLGVLAGGIAHDFNNLLGGLFGFVDLAREASHEPEVVELLSEALAVFGRARGITQQLLTFSRGGSPIRELDRVDLVLESTARFVLSGSSVSLKLELEPSLDACDYDAAQLSQVFQNLLLNAVEAMSGGGQLQITARNRELEALQLPGLAAGRYVEFVFTDHGPGISPALQARIFDPFFTTKSRGCGLGLVSSLSIMRRHFGTILVESEPGHGATFRVLLPSTRAALPPRISTAPSTHRGAGRVLVLDDEEYLQRLLVQMLEPLGYEVVTSSTATEAWDLWQAAYGTSARFSLVILDLTLPGGPGGCELMLRIREQDQELRSIVSSGYAEDPVLANPTKYGFDARLPKPYRREELLAALELVASMKRSR